MAALWLAGLGAFFYASYGLSDWVTSTRTHVPEVAFGWERAVPFLAWTIAPYWTTNLLYAGSFFLCRTGAELVAHARRLLTVQVVCVACFLVVPLQFSWAKPASPGAYGWLYAALGSFDKPYNQAPSLHVALTVVLAALYLGRVPRWLQFSFAAWSGLIVASVMTTFQHHFIDIPTGVLAGLVCVWVWPLDGARRVLVGCGTRGALLAWRYAAGALVCAGFAAAWRDSWLWLLWPAFSLLCVALGYRCFGTQVFDKRSDGRLPWTSSAMLLPYLVAARINSRLWTRGSAKCVAVADGVWIGRFPGAGDANGFATVVDLTAEMWTPRTTAAWRSFPMLDLVAPEPAALVAAAVAVEQARQRGRVLVVCALGYGRSVATAAVWLVRTGRATDVACAVALLRRARPRMHLAGEQMEAIQKAVEVKDV